MTAVAQNLAPPAQPVMRSTNFVGTIIVGLVTLLSFLVFLGILMDRNFMPSFISGLVFVALLVATIFLALIERRADNRHFAEHTLAMQRWSLAMQRWDLAYYCPKCDQVHLADTRQVVPVHGFGHLL